MAEARFDPKATLAQVEPLLAEARKQAQQIQRQQKELQTLTKQIGAELQSLTTRKADREEAVRVFEASAGVRPPAEVREVYAALSEATSRHYMMQTQLDTLRQREQWLAGQQTSLQRVVETVETVAKALGVAAEQAPASEPRGEPANERSTPEDLARRLVAQREEQSRWLAQHLQNGPMQALSNLVLQAEVSQRLLGRDVERARTEIQNLKETVVRALGDARFFVAELHPPTLEEVGLRATIRRYVADLAGRAGRVIEINLPGQDARFAPELETAVFRITQESLHYLLRNTQHGALALTLTIDPASIAVEVLGPSLVGDENDGAATLDLIRLYAQAVGGRFHVHAAGSDSVTLGLELPLSTPS
ncbi:MAG: sensor histidine kinase [Chloroflexota bacterium]